MLDANGPHYFVVMHSPGPAWVPGTAYNDQPDFQKHADYISGLQDQGKIVISGPFMKVPGGLSGTLADGGMAVLQASNLEEAIGLAIDDPTVRSGMIEAKVRTMWVPFHD